MAIDCEIFILWPFDSELLKRRNDAARLHITLSKR